MKPLKSKMATMALAIAACWIFAGAAVADDWRYDHHESAREHWARVHCHDYGGSFGPNGCYIPTHAMRVRMLQDGAAYSATAVYVEPPRAGVTVTLP